jgi:hypothetical protein
MKLLLLPCIVLTLISCKSKKADFPVLGDYEICDTCISQIVVEHHECTDCRDIIVDSGIVFIPSLIIKTYDSLYKTKSPYYQRLLVSELNFNDSRAFDTLWPRQTIRNTRGDINENYRNFNKRFRLTGRVVKLERVMSPLGGDITFPSLNFDILSSEALDSAYIQEPYHQ